jgi:U3 small nucleolar RNA-associated protein 5
MTQDASMDLDGPASREIDGELDVDIAELSLGQRLAALPGSTSAAKKDDDESDSDTTPGDLSRKGKKKDASSGGRGFVPAASLTRTLIQALHSSDDRLLETCLAHSEPGLIRNTVQKLPPQLAVPLLNACMARLGRGGRGGQRGAGASAQRGTGTVRWVNAVLAVHCGSLLTVSSFPFVLSAIGF